MILNSPIPSVLAKHPGIVNYICQDDYRSFCRFENLEPFDDERVKLGIVGISGCNRAGKGETIPIDQSTQLVLLYPLIAIIAG